MIVTVLPSTTTTINQGAAQTFADVAVPNPDKAIDWTCNVTAVALEAVDSYDIFVQTQVDGTNWVDVIHFTQVLGNGGAKRFHVTCNKNTLQAMFEQAAALATGTVRHLFGERYRVRIAIVDANLNGSITFSVTANVQ